MNPTVATGELELFLANLKCKHRTYGFTIMLKKGHSIE